MPRLALQIARYALLTVITVVACGVMWWVSRRDVAVASQGQAGTVPPAVAAAPKARVAVAQIRPQMSEITITASGKIRPWETYSLGFEVAGRVSELGVDVQSQPLDDGARVDAGQVLAMLDDRTLRARLAEAVAQLEQAASDLQSGRNLRDRGGRQAITDTEFRELRTAMSLAQAQHEIAKKNLEDTVLKSPVSGTISRRMVEAGESVTAHAMVFEVVENDQVLLAVDVPESRVRELQLREQAVARARAAGAAGDPESQRFRARVQLEGRDVFGRPWPVIDAEVYRIAEMADERTGLFEVEILIPNADGLLRPGMVATAQLVTDRILAYPAPENAVTFRGRDAFLYCLAPESATVEAMFWEVGQTNLHRAERIDLTQWVDQGDVVLIPAAQVELGPVVVRGQQRLADGALVRVTNSVALADGAAPEITARRSSASD